MIIKWKSPVLVKNVQSRKPDQISSSGCWQVLLLGSLLGSVYLRTKIPYTSNKIYTDSYVYPDWYTEIFEQV